MNFSPCSGERRSCAAVVANWLHAAVHARERRQDDDRLVHVGDAQRLGADGLLGVHAQASVYAQTTAYGRTTTTVADDAMVLSVEPVT